MSQVKQYNADHIQQEFNEASHHQEEYKRVKWGSQESMENRFSLALSIINFKNIKKCLDIGCGTGRFFERIVQLYPNLNLTGIDISENLINQAFYKDFNGANISFHCADFNFTQQKSNYDLITMIGVLQKTNDEPKNIFQKSFNILNKNGKIFIITKNLSWEKFTSGELAPEPLHNWFKADDIIKDIQNAGFKVIETNGFIPKENKIVDLNQSHTFYIYGEKPD